LTLYFEISRRKIWRNFFFRYPGLGKPNFWHNKICCNTFRKYIRPSMCILINQFTLNSLYTFFVKLCKAIMSNYKACSLVNKNKSNFLIAKAMRALCPSTDTGIAALVIDDTSLNSSFTFKAAFRNYNGIVVNDGPDSDEVARNCKRNDIFCLKCTALEFMYQFPSKEFDLFYLDACSTYHGSASMPLFNTRETVKTYFSLKMARAPSSILAVTIFCGRGAVPVDVPKDIRSLALPHGYDVEHLCTNTYFHMKTFIFHVVSAYIRPSPGESHVIEDSAPYSHLSVKQLGLRRLEKLADVVPGKRILCEWETGEFWPAFIVKSCGRDGLTVRFDDNDYQYNVRFLGRKKNNNIPRWVYLCH